jgi:hypothetical protein
MRRRNVRIIRRSPSSTTSGIAGSTAAATGAVLAAPGGGRTAREPANARNINRPETRVQERATGVVRGILEAPNADSP